MSIIFCSLCGIKILSGVPCVCKKNKTEKKESPQKKKPNKSKSEVKTLSVDEVLHFASAETKLI